MWPPIAITCCKYAVSMNGTFKNTRFFNKRVFIFQFRCRVMMLRCVKYQFLRGFRRHVWKVLPMCCPVLLLRWACVTPEQGMNTNTTTVMKRLLKSCNTWYFVNETLKNWMFFKELAFIFAFYCGVVTLTCIKYWFLQWYIVFRATARKVSVFTMKYACWNYRVSPCFCCMPNASCFTVNT